MILTIGKTAAAVGLSKTTICKHIESGKLSAAWNNDTNPPQREIDASEILRVYGVDVTAPLSRRPTIDTKKSSVDTPLEVVIKAKDETIAALKAEIDRLDRQVAVKDEQIAATNRLLAAPKADDRHTALLDRLETLQREFTAKELASQHSEPVPPLPKVAAADPSNRGIFGWFKRKAA